MLKNIIKSRLKRSHYWRDVHFDELSELYVSNLIRSVALTIFMVFVPFFLYQHGYSGAAILSVFGFMFATRVVFDIVGGYLVARQGPKHTMIFSCILQIVNAAMLLSVPHFNWHPILIAIPWGISNSFFFISYHVVFSKIKHTVRAGHELGHMMAYEKVGYLIGPIIGGVVGSVVGPQYIFLVATLLLFASLWPLFLTVEPTQTHQRLDFKGLPVHKIKNDIKAYCSLGIENSLCINIWPMYVAIFILSGSVYAKLGALAAVGVLAAILSAKVIGRLTDTSQARRLLRVSAVFNSLMYAVRPFVQNIAGVFAVNVANEALTTGYRMPFTKGMYTAADDLPGHRIVYIVSMESIASVVKATVWFMLAILALALPFKTVLLISFGVAAIASLGIMQERFKIYN